MRSGPVLRIPCVPWLKNARRLRRQKGKKNWTNVSVYGHMQADGQWNAPCPHAPRLCDKGRRPDRKVEKCLGDRLHTIFLIFIEKQGATVTSSAYVNLKSSIHVCSQAIENREIGRMPHNPQCNARKATLPQPCSDQCISGRRPSNLLSQSLILIPVECVSSNQQGLIHAALSMAVQVERESGMQIKAPIRLLVHNPSHRSVRLRAGCCHCQTDVKLMDLYE